MIDQAAIQQNEKMLADFLDRADKKFVTQVGIMSLTLLTEQMPPAQYQQFVASCIQNAHQLVGYSLLNRNTPKGVEAPVSGPEDGTAGPPESETEAPAQP